MSRIPVVDISPFLDATSGQQQRDACVEAVRAAAADWGVMHIAGHSIPAELMDHLHAGEWEDYLFHLVQPDGLADHALFPAHPPNYVPATRDLGRRTQELTSTLLAILSMGLLGPDAATR